MTPADKVVATLGALGWIYCALLWINFSRERLPGERAHKPRRKFFP